MQIIYSLGIIAPIVLLGILSRRLQIIPKEDSKVLSFFVYYFALPALFISKIAKINISTLEPKIVSGSVLPIILLVAFLFVLKKIKLINKDCFILSALAIVFGSNAFFGIPFFESYGGQSGLDFAIITSSVLGPLGMLLSILLFEYATKKENSGNILKKVLINPLILSIIVGVFFSLIDLKENSLLIKPFELLGKSAGPVAIFTLGIFMFDNFSFSTIKKSIGYSLFRFIFLPIATFVSLYLLGITGEIKNLLILQSGIPAAISLAVFSQRYNYKTSIIGDLVIMTSIFSFFSLGILHLLTRVFA